MQGGVDKILLKSLCTLAQVSEPLEERIAVLRVAGAVCTPRIFAAAGPSPALHVETG